MQTKMIKNINILSWNVDTNGTGGDTKKALQSQHRSYDAEQVFNDQIQVMKNYSVVCLEECTYSNIAFIAQQLNYDVVSLENQGNPQGKKGVVILYDKELGAVELGGFVFKTQLKGDFQNRGLVYVSFSQEPILSSETLVWVVCTHLTSGRFDTSKLTSGMGIGNSEREHQTNEVLDFTKDKPRCVIALDSNDFANELSFKGFEKESSSVNSLIGQGENQELADLKKKINHYSGGFLGTLITPIVGLTKGQSLTDVGKNVMGVGGTEIDRIYAKGLDFAKVEILKDVVLSDHYPWEALLYGPQNLYINLSNWYMGIKENLSLFIPNFSPVERESSRPIFPFNAIFEQDKFALACPKINTYLKAEQSSWPTDNSKAAFLWRFSADPCYAFKIFDCQLFYFYEKEKKWIPMKEDLSFEDEGTGARIEIEF